MPRWARRELKAVLSIILLSIVAAVTYGILHDQITARICVEYFTVGHPPVFGTDDPTLLGFGWGILATWWVGLILGILLALAARFGARPKLGARQLVRPLAMMLLIVGAFATLAGFIGHAAAQRGWVVLLEPMASILPRQRHVPFITDLWIHLASYAGAFLGGVILCILVFRRRKRMTPSLDSPVHSAMVPTLSR
jgi:hypothetical protein